MISEPTSQPSNPQPNPPQPPPPAAPPPSAGAPAPAAPVADSTLVHEEERLSAKLRALGTVSTVEILKAAPRILFDPVEGPRSVAEKLGQLGGLTFGGIWIAALAILHPLSFRSAVSFDPLQYLFGVGWTLAGLALMVGVLHVFRRMLAQIDSARIIEDVMIVGFFAVPGAVGALLAAILSFTIGTDVLPMMFVVASKILGLLIMHQGLEDVGGLRGRMGIYCLVCAGAVASLTLAQAVSTFGIL